ncbi:MAG: DUF3427 domain-containing protein [Erysipelotrichaceae bacterium]
MSQTGASYSHSLIVNNRIENLFNTLTTFIYECDKFFFSVAFINYGGVQLLIDSLSDFSCSNSKTGKILTTDYQNFTDPKSLRKLRSLDNIETKIFKTDELKKGFHTKAYIFEMKDEYKIIIGSSNITQSALKSNVEWNSLVCIPKGDSYSKRVIDEFCSLWDMSDVITDDFLVLYEKRIQRLRNIERQLEIKINEESEIVGKVFQLETCNRLNEIREYSNSALIIAATGTGKTILSALDVKNYKPKKMLFLAHREDIIRKSADSFRKVLGSESDIGFFKASKKETKCRHVFSTIQTMARNYKMFSPFDFDYIVYDEAHHVCAKQYSFVREYFRPKFSLGMTATPERMDGGDIFRIFDNNVGLDIRLREALDQDLVAPFHYFGVTEYEGVKLGELDISNVDKLVKKLSNSRRVDYIIEKMNHYGFDGVKRKCLGFCANSQHAKYMVQEFNKKNIPSALVSAEISVDERERLVKRLENDQDELEVLFTIDVFNEGIDIPSVNQVLLLRPTKSAMIFIQQLGRGLRKHENKQYLTVIDFIANHSRAFLIAIALHGAKGTDKKNLRDFVKKDFVEFSDRCFIKMDQIVKEQILNQIEKENFYSKKYLAQEYQAMAEFLKKDPILMMDYEAFECGIDATKFLMKYNSYFQFHCIMVGNEHPHKKYLEDTQFMQVLKQISELLPPKRIHEFALLQAVIENPLSLGDFVEHVKVKFNIDDNETCKHAIDNLQCEFKNKIGKEKCIRLIKFEDNKISLSESMQLLLESEFRKLVIMDVIQFGIVRYLKVFGHHNYGTPFMKPFETYHYKDVQLVSNYSKRDNWMKGVNRYKNDYFLFVNLVKDQDTPASQKYEDKIIDQTKMEWQTEGSTSVVTGEGKNLVKYKENNFNLHLLVRKNKKDSSLTVPFYYLGLVDAKVIEEKTPIKFSLEFREKIPSYILEELKLTDEDITK